MGPFAADGLFGGESDFVGFVGAVADAAKVDVLHPSFEVASLIRDASSVSENEVPRSFFRRFL
jgi:hypothetical protein